MATDDGVTSESVLVNVKLPGGRYRQENCIFSDNDNIIKLYGHVYS